jgi:threonine dehydrogenase-like Zn-dependent dehydrogenase
MRAYTLNAGTAALSVVPDPAAETDEALLRIRVAGICNTDLELLRGYKGFSGIPGHEFVATVERCTADPALVGRRVVGEINVACHHCDLCLMGMPTQCRYRRTVGLIGHDGAFADRMTLVRENLHVVPDRVNDECAVFVEPLAAALNICDMAHVRPSDRVLLIGAGKLGLLCAQVLRLTGADVRVVARRKRPIELLRRWAIPVVSLDDVADASMDVVVDCTGNAEGFDAALTCVRPRGTVVLKSTYEGTPIADLTRVAVSEIRVVGSRCGPFQAALRMLDNRLVDVASIIDARYSLSDMPRAMAHAAQPGVLKVLVQPD